MRVEVDLDKCTGHGILRIDRRWCIRSAGRRHGTDPRLRAAGSPPRAIAAGRDAVPRCGPTP